MNRATKKRIVYSFLGMEKDRKISADGEKRPSILLASSPELQFDEFHLIWQRGCEELLDKIVNEMREKNPQAEFFTHEITFRNPWNFEEVYSCLYDFFNKQAPDPDHGEYYAYISTGTHTIQICLFLLVESRHLPGKLLQCNTADRQNRQLTVIDLNLISYSKIAKRFNRRENKAQVFLKSNIATRNEKFNSLISEIGQVAVSSPAPILLTGPTGAGKTRLAGKIFELKKNRNIINGEFVPVNCATMRGDQAMSTLFGHKKGAFTGASADRAGLLKKADMGLLFLDEIGELGMDEQAMLLRAIEEKRFLPLGADHEEASDFQLICGTNRDLREQVRKGFFREDLLERINLWTFRMPGLAERREDIEPNLDYELLRCSDEFKRNISIQSEARTLFMQYALNSNTAWNGNFRELAAMVTRMATLAPDGRIDCITVQNELERNTASAAADDGNNMQFLQELLPAGYRELYDEFDLVQLAYTVKVCRSAKNISEAGRKLFAVSRTMRKSRNDTDRLTKYLAKFNLKFEDILRCQC